MRLYPAALICLLAGCAVRVPAQMATPTAVFPGGVVTDAQLKVETNGVQTTITANVGPTDAAISVRSCVNIPANSFAAIDSEIIAVSLCSGNTLSVATTSPGCTNGRACDGTTATSHFVFGTSGAPVNLRIVAWHHNSLKAEIEAIETALGVNLTNVCVLTGCTFTGVISSNSNISTSAEVRANGGVSGGDPVFASVASCTGGLQGFMTAISDSTTNTWGATITVGGGTDPVLAWCNGTNWTVIGK